MRVLVVATPLASLSAAAVTGAVAAGWRRAAPSDQVSTHLLATGTRGLREVLPPGVAVIEAVDMLDHSAQAFITGTTAPLGEALLRALPGESRVVVGAGLTRVHDGGRGFADVLVRRWGSLRTAHEALHGVELELVGADPAPLLGLHGAGAMRAAEVGAAAAQGREREVAAFAAEVEAQLGSPDPDTGRPVRWARAPWSGLAGGAGFVLLALGARAAGGEEYTAAATGLGAAVGGADLCVVVLEELDEVALGRSTLTAVAPAALEAAVPVVVLSGEDHTARRHRAGLGVVGSYTCSLEADGLREAGRRLARTWSPH